MPTLNGSFVATGRRPARSEPAAAPPDRGEATPSRPDRARAPWPSRSTLAKRRDPRSQGVLPIARSRPPSRRYRRRAGSVPPGAASRANPGAQECARAAAHALSVAGRVCELVQYAGPDCLMRRRRPFSECVEGSSSGRPEGLWAELRDGGAAVVEQARVRLAGLESARGTPRRWRSDASGSRRATEGSSPDQ